MYYNPIYTKDYGVKNVQKRFIGYVRVMHTVPNAPNVDVYADDKLIVENLSYAGYTAYMPLIEGTYEISLYVTGTKDAPVLTNMLIVNKDDILTVAACGTLSDISFLAISDANMPIKENNTMIRFAHLSPNAPAVDITLLDGTILFSNVSFKQVASYISVPASNYTLQVRLSGTPTVVLTVPNIKLKPNEFYTVYAIGLVGEKPELQALLVLDGKNQM